MRDCIKCGIEKPLEDFYKRGSAGGRSNKCKECTKSDVRLNRSINLDKYKSYDRQRASNPDRVEARKAYAKTDAGIESAARARRNYKRKNMDKVVATNAVNNGLRDGKFTKPLNCSACGSGGIIQGHHWDYSKPLEVQWLCIPCHVVADKCRREAMDKGGIKAVESDCLKDFAEGKRSE